MLELAGVEDEHGNPLETDQGCVSQLVSAPLWLLHTAAQDHDPALSSRRELNRLPF